MIYIYVRLLLFSPFFRFPFQPAEGAAAMDRMARVKKSNESAVNTPAAKRTIAGQARFFKKRKKTDRPRRGGGGRRWPTRGSTAFSSARTKKANTSIDCWGPRNDEIASRNAACAARSRGGCNTAVPAHSQEVTSSICRTWPEKLSSEARATTLNPL